MKYKFIVFLFVLLGLRIITKAEQFEPAKTLSDSIKSVYHVADSVFKRLDTKYLTTPYLVDRVPFNRFVQFNPRIIS